MCFRISRNFAIVANPRYSECDPPLFHKAEEPAALRTGACETELGVLLTCRHWRGSVFYRVETLYHSHAHGARCRPSAIPDHMPHGVQTRTVHRIRPVPSCESQPIHGTLRALCAPVPQRGPRLNEGPLVLNPYRVRFGLKRPADGDVARGHPVCSSRLQNAGSLFWKVTEST